MSPGTDLLIRSKLLVQHQSSVRKGLAVTSKRLLFASARLQGSCSSWACCGLQGNAMGRAPSRRCGTQAAPPECVTGPVHLHESMLLMHTLCTNFLFELSSSLCQRPLRFPGLALGTGGTSDRQMEGGTGCCTQALHGKPAAHFLHGCSQCIWVCAWGPRCNLRCDQVSTIFV